MFGVYNNEAHCFGVYNYNFIDRDTAVASYNYNFVDRDTPVSAL